jgi:hypothetical protein
MSKNEKVPSFGKVCEIRKTNNQKTSLERAEREKEQARIKFEQSRSFLMKCTRKVQDIKATIYFEGKEVCNG